MQATLDRPVAIQPAHEEDCGCPLCRIYRYPNAETLAAMAEVDKMIRTGSGQHYKNIDELWADLED